MPRLYGASISRADPFAIDKSQSLHKVLIVDLGEQVLWCGT
jgi:hypothetical protein